MSDDRQVAVLRELIGAFDGVVIDVRGCDVWTFDSHGLIARKDSFWKICDA